MKGLLMMLLLVWLGLSACMAPQTAPQPGPTEAALSPQPSAAVYQKISAEQAKAMMDEGGDYVLLDVRTQAEYDEQHIEDALLIPDTEIVARAEGELPNLNAVVLVYCRSGRRSANAARELLDMGYTQVYDFGGIIDWPYETVGL